MKRLLIAAVAATAFAGAASAQDFQLRKGVIVADDFGDRLGIGELRDGLKARGFKVQRPITGTGDKYRVLARGEDGDLYKFKVNRAGEVTWYTRLDGFVKLIN
ncbi:MAG: hypothetical protein AAFX03_06975 [Pseudomonadota bacterium]